MHTVKSRESIKEAYFNYGVKTFSLDTKDELIKIIESTNNAKDLELFVRVAVSNEHAEIDLSKKFYYRADLDIYINNLILILTTMFLFQGSLRRLEATIEEDYLNQLRQACFREKSYKENLLWQARYSGNSNLLNRAHNYETPSCDSLEKLYSY